MRLSFLHFRLPLLMPYINFLPILLYKSHRNRLIINHIRYSLYKFLFAFLYKSPNSQLYNSLIINRIPISLYKISTFFSYMHKKKKHPCGKLIPQSGGVEEFVATLGLGIRVILFVRGGRCQSARSGEPTRNRLVRRFLCRCARAYVNNDTWAGRSRWAIKSSGRRVCRRGTSL